MNTVKLGAQPSIDMISCSVSVEHNMEHWNTSLGTIKNLAALVRRSELQCSGETDTFVRARNKRELSVVHLVTSDSPVRYAANLMHKLESCRRLGV